MPNDKLKDNKENNNKGHTRVDIVDQMRSAHLDYAMSVITSRALPDVRDGLKPVNRRILYSMYKSGLAHSTKTRKSSKIIGNVMGDFHPHGNVAIYEAMVKMIQPFSTRYPLAIGQGNFGSIDGDNAGAERYTEAKLAKISTALLDDIDKNTVSWRPNYENTIKEPILLPATFPHLLVNGTFGIAVGMAANIPPHNLQEVCAATIHTISQPDCSVNDIMKYMKGPDFPLGGIIYNKADISNAFANGRGSITIRGEAEIIEEGKKRYIAITSIPYRVKKAELQEKIAGLYKSKKIDDIKDMRDESTSDIRIIIELKPSAQPQKILNALYKYTSLESKVPYNMTALLNSVPQTFSVKGIITAFIEFRRDVVKRRATFELDKATARAHIVEGLKKAIDKIDVIIDLIKKSQDAKMAHVALMKKFKFTDIQATAILEIKLQKLAGLERKQIEEELKALQSKIAQLQDFIKSKKKMDNTIIKELEEVSANYGDKRRTRVESGAVKTLSATDLIPSETTVISITNEGYIKRSNPNEYRKQKRGGKGVSDTTTKEEDVIKQIISANTHDTLLLFTTRGKVFSLPVHEIPEGKKSTRGKSIHNFLTLMADEKITSVLAVGATSKEFILFTTRNGIVKKMDIQHFSNIRQSGIVAIGLKKDDSMISALEVSDTEDVYLATQLGKGIRFHASTLRSLGRTASGVRGVKLKEKDIVIAAAIIAEDNKDTQLTTFTAKGYAKRTKISEYKCQSKGGSGIAVADITTKTGNLVATAPVKGDEDIVIISKLGQILRTDIKGVKVSGRVTQGVCIMKFKKKGDAIASVVTYNIKE